MFEALLSCLIKVNFGRAKEVTPAKEADTVEPQEDFECFVTSVSLEQDSDPLEQSQVSRG